MCEQTSSKVGVEKSGTIYVEPRSSLRAARAHRPLSDLSSLRACLIVMEFNATVLFTLATPSAYDSSFKMNYCCDCVCSV